MAKEKKTRERLGELRNASEAEMDVIILNAQKSIYQFRKDKMSKPQENVKVVRNSRKEIARVLTIKRERELEAAKEG